MNRTRVRLFVRYGFCLLLVPVLASCSRIELASHFGKKLVASEKSKGHYKVGRPYTIKGKRYYPSVDYAYNETGIASWYGPGFHGKATANGETYDQNELTAAHKTLPLPSIVRVTNLENGKSLIVRVNDRGPYAHGRIIDMSQRAAQLLGFRNKGIAKVRVEVLESESIMVANAAKSGQDTRGMEVPMNKPSYRSPNIRMASARTPAQPSKKPQPVQKVAQTTLQAKDKSGASTSIPGHVKNGNFYPDAMVSEYAVGSPKVFVQTASFSERSSAMKYASGLRSFGRAQVHPVTVEGSKFYRVRLPAPNVDQADMLLSRLVNEGYKNAMIVVD